MGNALKKNTGWQGGGNGTNEYGFNGLGGGHAWPDGRSQLARFILELNDQHDGGGDLMHQPCQSDHLTRSSYRMGIGCSVRCVADRDLKADNKKGAYAPFCCSPARTRTRSSV